MGYSVGFATYHHRRLKERWYRVLVRDDQISDALSWLSDDDNVCSVYYTWVSVDKRWHLLITNRHVAFECKMRFG